jgi:hypothetical protein
MLEIRKYRFRFYCPLRKKWLKSPHALPLGLIVGQWQVVELLGKPEILRFPAGIERGASHLQSTALPRKGSDPKL